MKQLIIALSFALAAEPTHLEQKPNTWVKRSPLPGGPVRHLRPGVQFMPQP